MGDQREDWLAAGVARINRLTLPEIMDALGAVWHEPLFEEWLRRLLATGYCVTLQNSTGMYCGSISDWSIYSDGRGQYECSGGSLLHLIGRLLLVARMMQAAGRKGVDAD